MKMLEVNNLRVDYGRNNAVSDVSFSLDEGEWLMLAGPNGAGKSTVIKAVSGELPFEGDVICRGRNIREMKSRELAANMGVLAQNLFCEYSFTVREVVSLGRYSHRKGLFGGDEKAEEAVEEALEAADLKHLSEKPVTGISGGEMQRVFLAQLFAQDPRILILDEPTNHLDPVHVKRLLDLVSEWIRKPGRCALTVVHDLSLAGKYSDRTMLISDGKEYACGTPQKVLTKENLIAVYGTDVQSWMKEIGSFWNDLPG